MTVVPNYTWDNDINNAEVLWTDNTGVMLGVQGKWQLGLIRFNRELSGPDAILEELTSQLIFADLERANGPMDDFKESDTVLEMPSRDTQTIRHHLECRQSMDCSFPTKTLSEPDSPMVNSVTSSCIRHPSPVKIRPMYTTACKRRS